MMPGPTVLSGNESVGVASRCCSNSGFGCPLKVGSTKAGGIWRSWVQSQYGRAKSLLPVSCRTARSYESRYALCQGRKYQLPWGHRLKPLASPWMAAKFAQLTLPDAAFRSRTPSRQVCRIGSFCAMPCSERRNFGAPCAIASMPVKLAAITPAPITQPCSNTSLREAVMTLLSCVGVPLTPALALLTRATFKCITNLYHSQIENEGAAK